MRIARFVAPSLVVLLLGGVLIGVLVSNSGSAKSACPGAASGVTLSASQREHCRHGGTAVAENNLGEPATGGGTEGTGRGAGSSGTSHGIAAGISGAVDAANTGSEGTAAGNGGTTAGNGGTAAGGSGAAGSGSTDGAGASGSTGSPSAATPVADAGAGISAGLSSDGVLAPGRTETGTWATQSPLVLPPQLEPHWTEAAIRFPVRLKRTLLEEAVTYVNEAETKKPGTSRSTAIKAACGESGTLEAPTANPGHLCVYSGGEDFRDRNSSGGIPTHSGHPFVDAEYIAIVRQDNTEGADKSGAAVAFGFPDILTAEEEAAHAIPHVVAHGSWAVTGKEYPRR